MFVVSRTLQTLSTARGPPGTPPEGVPGEATGGPPRQGGGPPVRPTSILTVVFYASFWDFSGGLF